MPTDHPMGLSELAAGVVDQTRRLSAVVRDADLATDIPTCPGWNLATLTRHVGGVHRWADRVVRDRASSPVFHDGVDDASGDTDVSPDELADWLDDGAVALAAALEDAGPDTPIWTIAPGGTAVFWARRSLHDTVLHRADAEFATGGRFTVAPAIAADGIDEWVASSTLVQAYASAQRYRDLIREGRAIRLRAVGDSPVKHWLIDLGADPMTWRHGDEAATVTISGSPTDLLLLLYRRDAHAAATIDGDAKLWWRFRYDAADWLRR
ncbi:maleylpyruvate isomerase family mycothiol-dependent enzyme [Stackebrandtia endophytica]|nr:maleylpyruvate isomerase family mycothiol-dependent enzyme [Stackebrandtia endophytica]